MEARTTARPQIETIWCEKCKHPAGANGPFWLHPASPWPVELPRLISGASSNLFAAKQCGTIALPVLRIAGAVREPAGAAKYGSGKSLRLLEHPSAAAAWW